MGDHTIARISVVEIEGRIVMADERAELLTAFETRPLTDAEHDRLFTILSDETWGAGNWLVCHECPADDAGRPVRHHCNAHRASS